MNDAKPGLDNAAPLGLSVLLNLTRSLVDLICGHLNERPILVLDVKGLIVRILPCLFELKIDRIIRTRRSILDAEVVENPRSDLWRLRGISAKYGLNGIRASMVKNSMTMFMSEVLYRTIHDGDTEDGLYDWCRRSILTLDALEGDYANYHLRFLLEFAAALGFSPSTEDLAPFGGGRSREIAALAGEDFSSCMLLPLSGQARGEIAGQLLKYLEFHTGEQLNIRSLAVLRELYGK